VVAPQGSPSHKRKLLPLSQQELLNQKMNGYYFAFILAAGTLAFTAFFATYFLFGATFALAGFGFTVFFGASCATAAMLNSASTENIANTFFMIECLCLSYFNFGATLQERLLKPENLRNQWKIAG
jgi:hypothetical protein